MLVQSAVGIFSFIHVGVKLDPQRPQRFEFCAHEMFPSATISPVI
jgi:hypothetical protein